MTRSGPGPDATGFYQRIARELTALLFIILAAAPANPDRFSLVRAKVKQQTAGSKLFAIINILYSSVQLPRSATQASNRELIFHN